MTTEIVRGRDVREGDMLTVGGRVIRVARLEPYTHPTLGAARIARYPSPYAPALEEGITLFDSEPVVVMR